MSLKMTTPLLVLALISQTVKTSASSGLATDSTTSTTTMSDSGVNDSSNSSSSGNSFAQAVNYVAGGAEVVTGGYMIKTGSAHDNWGEVAAGVLLVSMGLTNIAQGNEHGSAATTADTTAAATDGLSSSTSTDSTSSSTDSYVTAALSDANFQAVGSTMSELVAAGVYDPKTGNFSVDGTTYSAGDLASTGAMSAAGISQSAIDTALAANTAAEKTAIDKLQKVKSTENGYEDGGSGGKGSITVGNSAAEGAKGIAGVSGKMTRKTAADTTASVAGLSKNLNGEPIGVAADNIFSMIKRRYQLKESQDSFIENSDLLSQK